MCLGVCGCGCVCLSGRVRVCLGVHKNTSCEYLSLKGSVKSGHNNYFAGRCHRICKRNNVRKELTFVNSDDVKIVEGFVKLGESCTPHSRALQLVVGGGVVFAVTCVFCIFHYNAATVCVCVPSNST